MLGLGNNLKKGGLTTPGIITDSLVLKHKYDAGSVAPVSDGAAYFDGTDDYITMGDISATEGIDTMTLACWAYLTDAAQHPLITKGTYNNSAASFNFKYDLQSGTDSGNGRLNFSVANNIYAFKSSAGYTINKWHHFAVTYSNTADEIWFYVDGVKITPNSSGSESGVGTAVSIPNTAKEVRIGTSDGGTEYAQGYICNASIWSSALTQEQIKSIMWKNYAGLTTSEKTNLVSWWNLDSSVSDNYSSTYTFDNHYGGNSSELGSEIYTTNNALSTVNYESALPEGIISGTSDGLTCNGLNVQYNNSTYKIGSYSLKSTSVNAQDSRFSTSFSTTSGKSYEISFYMKFNTGIYTTATSGVQETYSFKVGTSDNDTTNANIALLDIHTLTETTGDWYNYKIRFTASASTSHFTFIKTDSIGLGRSSNGIFMDDFSVKELQGNPGELK